MSNEEQERERARMIQRDIDRQSHETMRRHDAMIRSWVWGFLCGGTFVIFLSVVRGTCSI